MINLEDLDDIENTVGEYDDELQCDSCGHIGAYDLNGSFICEECMGNIEDDDEIDELDFE